LDWEKTALKLTISKESLDTLARNITIFNGEEIFNAQELQQGRRRGY